MCGPSVPSGVTPIGVSASAAICPTIETAPVAAPNTPPKSTATAGENGVVEVDSHTCPEESGRDRDNGCKVHCMGDASMSDTGNTLVPIRNHREGDCKDSTSDGSDGKADRNGEKSQRGVCQQRRAVVSVPVHDA